MQTFAKKSLKATREEATQVPSTFGPAFPLSTIRTFAHRSPHFCSTPSAKPREKDRQQLQRSAGQFDSGDEKAADNLVCAAKRCLEGATGVLRKPFGLCTQSQREVQPRLTSFRLCASSGSTVICPSNYARMYSHSPTCLVYRSPQLNVRPAVGSTHVVV